MKILVVNAGSSSIKYQLIDMKNEKLLAKGYLEKIGIDGSFLTHKAKGEKFVITQNIANHQEGMDLVINTLLDEKMGVIKSLKEIDAVGHRVLHGGETFTDSALVTDDVMKKIEELIPLGPLHQPANIMGIKSCQKLLPGVPNVAVFDTTFHATMPDYAYRYALPKDCYTELKIRKYGFHGTSHKFIASELERLTGKKGNFIIAHIGSGASLSAVKDGKCVDTTMGYTPLEGVMMGTRTGDIDPSVLETIMDKKNMNIHEAISYLNKKSGLQGVSCVSADMRDVELIAYSDEQSVRADDCRLSLKMHAYRVKKYIGAYYAVLGTVDAIAFTAGVGENGSEYRAEVLKGLEGLGIIIDENKNSKDFKRGEINLISAPNSKVLVYVIPTDEEMMIAKDTLRLAK